MTVLQIVHAAATISQAALGIYCLLAGWKLTTRWDRTDLDYHAGTILAAIGAVIILIAMRGL